MSVINDLKQDFTGVGQVRGFKFTQISKTDSGFMYEVDTGNTIYYEVFKRRFNSRFNCISYPTNKAFSIWAWTTPRIIRAFEILNELSMEHSSVSAIHKTNTQLQMQSELPKKFCV